MCGSINYGQDFIQFKLIMIIDDSRIDIALQIY